MEENGAREVSGDGVKVSRNLPALGPRKLCAIKGQTRPKPSHKQMDVHTLDHMPNVEEAGLFSNMIMTCHLAN